jgi:hypothetical protein
MAKVLAISPMLMQQSKQLVVARFFRRLKQSWQVGELEELLEWESNLGSLTITTADH